MRGSASWCQFPRYRHVGNAKGEPGAFSEIPKRWTLRWSEVGLDSDRWAPVKNRLGGPVFMSLLALRGSTEQVSDELRFWCLRTSVIPLRITGRLAGCPAGNRMLRYPQRWHRNSGSFFLHCLLQYHRHWGLGHERHWGIIDDRASQGAHPLVSHWETSRHPEVDCGWEISPDSFRIKENAASNCCRSWISQLGGADRNAWEQPAIEECGVSRHSFDAKAWSRAVVVWKRCGYQVRSPRWCPARLGAQDHSFLSRSRRRCGHGARHLLSLSGQGSGLHFAPSSNTDRRILKLRPNWTASWTAHSGTFAAKLIWSG